MAFLLQLLLHLFSVDLSQFYLKLSQCHRLSTFSFSVQVSLSLKLSACCTEHLLKASVSSPSCQYRFVRIRSTGFPSWQGAVINWSVAGDASDQWPVQRSLSLSSTGHRQNHLQTLGHTGIQYGRCHIHLFYLVIVGNIDIQLRHCFYVLPSVIDF